MPILDQTGTEIVHYTNFPDDDGVNNIEVGAGRNCFGKKYFNQCYLTDLSTPNYPHFSQNDNYDEINSHFLDEIVDFYNLTPVRTYNRIIFCNPVGFGFQGKENAKKILNKAGELLNLDGEILVVGNSTNGWAKYDSATKWLGRLVQDGLLDYNFQISALSPLTENHIYRTDHMFWKMTVDEPTIVNQMFTITKIA